MCPRHATRAYSATADHQWPHLLGWWMVTHTVRPPRASLRQGAVISVDNQQCSGAYALLPALRLRAAAGHNGKQVVDVGTAGGPESLNSPQQRLHHADRHLRVQAAAQGRKENKACPSRLRGPSGT